MLHVGMSLSVFVRCFRKSRKQDEPQAAPASLILRCPKLWEALDQSESNKLEDLVKNRTICSAKGETKHQRVKAPFKTKPGN